MKKLDKFKPPLLKQNYTHSKLPSKEVSSNQINTLQINEKQAIGAQLMLKLKEGGQSKSKSKIKLKEKHRSGSRTGNRNDMVASIEKVHKIQKQQAYSPSRESRSQANSPLNNEKARLAAISQNPYLLAEAMSNESTVKHSNETQLLRESINLVLSKESSGQKKKR